MNEVNAVNLPKHNFILRSFYILFIIGMFIFMAMLIGEYWREGTSVDTTGLDDSSIKHAEYDSQINSQIAEYYSVENDLNDASERNSKKLGLVQRPELTLLTMSYRLNLKKPIEDQLSYFWQSLFDDNVLLSSNLLESNRTVYQVFRNYEPTKNSVEILLGFAVKSSTDKSSTEFTLTNPFYELLSLKASFMLPRKSVLGSWQNFEQLPIKLSYELDYEIFQLDARYQTLSQKAFLNPR